MGTVCFRAGYQLIFTVSEKTTADLLYNILDWMAMTPCNFALTWLNLTADFNCRHIPHLGWGNHMFLI